MYNTLGGYATHHHEVSFCDFFSWDHWWRHLRDSEALQTRLLVPQSSMWDAFRGRAQKTATFSESLLSMNGWIIFLARAIGLWPWRMTVIILDIIRRSAFYFKQNVSESRLWLHLQVESIQLDPIDRTSLYLHRLSMFHLQVKIESSLRNVVS